MGRPFWDGAVVCGLVRVVEFQSWMLNEGFVQILGGFHCSCCIDGTPQLDSFSTFGGLLVEIGLVAEYVDSKLPIGSLALCLEYLR